MPATSCRGIADGIKAKGGTLDLWDVVAMNAYLGGATSPRRTTSCTRRRRRPKSLHGDHCSAFVATGSYTKDGKIVIAHNNWTRYIDGERWTIAFDVHPHMAITS